jgi:hypothetical protein
MAARGIGRQLRGTGCEVLASESSLVDDALEDGELERVRDCEGLARQLVVAVPG